MGDTVIIEFNQKDYDEYILEWKKKNPRRSKLPMNKPMSPSLNELLIIKNSILRNTKKQDFKKYTIWTCEKYGVDRSGITKCDLDITFIFPTQHKHDVDNYIGGSKFVLDGFTDCGLLVADDYKHLKTITGRMEYRKDVIGMIFKFYNCEYDKEAMENEMNKEKTKAEKRQATIDAKPKKKKKSVKKVK